MAPVLAPDLPSPSGLTCLVNTSPNPSHREGVFCEKPYPLSVESPRDCTHCFSFLSIRDRPKTLKMSFRFRGYAPPPPPPPQPSSWLKYSINPPCSPRLMFFFELLMNPNTPLVLGACFPLFPVGNEPSWFENSNAVFIKLTCRAFLRFSRFRVFFFCRFSPPQIFLPRSHLFAYAHCVNRRPPFSLVRTFFFSQGTTMPWS